MGVVVAGGGDSGGGGGGGSGSVDRPTDPLNSSVGSILWEMIVWIYNLTVTIISQKY